MSFEFEHGSEDIDSDIPIDFNSKIQKITDFRCDQCGKYFAASRSLILHKKIHAGIKPYVCPVEGCGKSFYVRAQLVRHSYSHTTIRTEKCPYKNCTSPIKLFKTKADVRQHIKNWHTLEKSELREQRLLKKLDKYKKFAENYKKLNDQNKELIKENKRLKAALATNGVSPSASTSVQGEKEEVEQFNSEQELKPVPAYTQFLREQYKLMKMNNEKLPFAECSKRIAKKWHSLSSAEKEPYLKKYRDDFNSYNDKKKIDSQPFPSMPSPHASPFINTNSIEPLYVCRKYTCGSNDICVLRQPMNALPLVDKDTFGQTASTSINSLSIPFVSNSSESMPQQSVASFL